MNGYLCFMKSVSLRLLILLLFAYQGNADCPPLVESNTNAEVGVSQAGKAVKGFFEGIAVLFSGKDKFDVAFDPKNLQYISVHAIKNQGIDDYFNPRIKVCDHEGENCSELYGGTSCHNIYGTQDSGAGVSAAVFIDWEGDKTVIGSKIAQTLEWEWANGVEEKDKKKFANSSKICACTQKGACMSGISSWFSRVVSGENIFRPGDMENVCDTCSSWQNGRQKIKCAPIYFLPGPPPFCDQLECSSPKVRIVPIREEDNNYFDPRIGVMVGGENKGDLHISDTNREQIIQDKDGNNFHFKTYKKEGKLCAEYYGNQGVNEKNLQLTRCFPSPPAPQPEVLEVIDNNTLKVKMKMSEEICRRLMGGNYNGSNKNCTFSINTRPQKIGPISLKVLKPRMNKTINNALDKALKNILSKNKEFQILQRYGCVPAINSKCEDSQGKCKLDYNGNLETEVQYENSEDKNLGKMLCISGWQPEPKEFVLERENEIIPIRLMGASYAKYNTVYSKESKQMHYFPLDETINILERPQDQLNDIVFDKKGYIIIPKDNEGRNMCIVEKDEELNKKKNSNECRLVYKLIDSEYKEACKPGDDGCIKDNSYRCTKYLRKDNNKPFFLRRVVGKDNKVESQEVPVRVNRAEVFYPEKLCKFNLQELKKKLNETIIKQLRAKKEKLEKQEALDFSHNFYGKHYYDFFGERGVSHYYTDYYTDDLSEYDGIEIEANSAGSTDFERSPNSLKELGDPGAYSIIKFKINPSYPIIRAIVPSSGKNGLNKDLCLVKIEICNINKKKCIPLMDLNGCISRGIEGKIKLNINDESLVYKNDRIVDIDGVSPICKNTSSYMHDNSGTIHAYTREGTAGCSYKLLDGTVLKAESGGGRVRIKTITKPPIISKLKEGEISNFIEKVTNDEIPNIDDPLINKLDPDIAGTIKKEIERELSCKLQAQPGAN